MRQSGSGWWKLAREWAEASRDLPHGDVQAELSAFSERRGIVDLTVRRAAAALRFAERLAQQKRLDSPERLKDVAITYLEILQRMDRMDPGEVDRLLPRLADGKVQGRELRVLEASLRGSARSRRGSEAGLLRMGAIDERRRLLDLLAAPGSPLRGRLVRLRPSRAVRPLVLDAIAVESSAGRRFLHGIRIFTAVSDAHHPRNVGYAALLGLAGSRVLNSIHLVFEDGSLAADVVAALRGWEAAGVGVICVNPDDGCLFVQLEARVRESVDPEFEPIRERVLRDLFPAADGLDS